MRGARRQTIEWNDIVKIKGRIKRGFLSRDVIIYGRNTEKLVLPHPQWWLGKDADQLRQFFESEAQRRELNS